jgi:SAM-dependent methyltransferase
MPIERRRLLPHWFPQWIQRRAEVDTYVLYQFIEETSKTLAPGTMLLDAGSGEGQYRQWFGHTRYVGIDMAVGDQAWNYRNLDIVGDLAHLPLVQGQFDAVLCTQVLEHVPEPSRVLAELHRVLKPGARLYLSAPQSWHQHQKPHDYYRFTSYGLRFLLGQAGFRIEQMRPMGGYFWFLAFQLQNLNYWLFPRGMRGRRWTWPLRALNGLVLQFLASLFLYYLDPLDRIKDETFGYVCVASKAGSVP